MTVTMPTSYLVTGALGCVGAWVVRCLVDDGVQVVALDAGSADHRLRMALGSTAQSPLVTRVTADVTDVDAVVGVMAEHSVDAVVHLAALQVPGVAAQPVLGARVNVVGMAVVLEAMRQLGVETPLAYASSVAAYGAQDSGAEADGELAGHAGTLYGVYKRANEGAAHVYWADHQVASVGLRPYVVYGPGRDQGMTADVTHAIGAAVRGEPYRIRFGGRFQLQYVQDVARAFVAVTRSEFRGAAVTNLGGPAVAIADVVAAIEDVMPQARGLVSFDDVALPFPAELESHADRYLVVPEPTSLRDGIAATARVLAAEQPGEQPGVREGVAG
jgi:nucleoside-diphosphate-sugar epimerase